MHIRSNGEINRDFAENGGAVATLRANPHRLRVVGHSGRGLVCSSSTRASVIDAQGTWAGIAAGVADDSPINER